MRRPPSVRGRRDAARAAAGGSRPEQPVATPASSRVEHVAASAELADGGKDKAKPGTAATRIAADCKELPDGDNADRGAACRRCACSRCPTTREAMKVRARTSARRSTGTPTVKTDAAGDATVSFPVSDAVTSFRATAEGVSAAGIAGHRRDDDPVEDAARARRPHAGRGHVGRRDPAADHAHERDRPAVDADLRRSSAPRSSSARTRRGKLHLEPHATSTPVRAALGRRDRRRRRRPTSRDDRRPRGPLDKKIRVVPLGFPFEVSPRARRRRARAHTTTSTSPGALPGSINATVTMYPSPLAAMTKGMEAMIREPGGCFEQTSSTNYPNVMVLCYLAANDAADPELVQSANDEARPRLQAAHRLRDARRRATSGSASRRATRRSPRTASWSSPTWRRSTTSTTRWSSAPPTG